MSKITMRTKNANKPAPKFWRKLEDVLLILLIPSIVVVLTSWGFEDEVFLNRILLLINTLLVAIVRGIGILLANGEDYVKTGQ